MCWKAKFKLLEGWFIDTPRFASRGEAEAYALQLANARTVIIDFDVVRRQQVPNSCWLPNG